MAESKERFIEKARAWPRVETADQFARLLSGVKPQRWKDYSYLANPPCHQSSSGTSLSFGDAPGGGLVIYCWACEGDTVQRVEDALGVALQVRRRDGNLRYRAALPGGQRPPEPRTAAPPRKPDPIHATPLREGITVGQFFDSPFWLLSNGKGRPATARGGLAAWRQSRDSRGGGVKLARFGGQARDVMRDRGVYQFRGLPWDTYDGILAKASDASLRVVPGAEPMVSLAGDEETRCLGDYLLVDLDYHPEHDLGLESRAVRDTIANRLADAGAALYTSRSGNGWHAVLRMSAYDIAAGRHPRRKRVDPQKVPGLALDFFPPSSRSPVNVCRERPLANTSSAHVLPTLTLAELEGVLRGRGRSELSELLEEAGRHTAEPDYAILVLRTAEDLAGGGGLRRRRGAGCGEQRTILEH